MILDLRMVEFMDSTGVKVLISERSRIDDAGGSLVLVVGDGPVRRLLDLTGVASGFQVVASLDEIDGE